MKKLFSILGLFIGLTFLLISCKQETATEHKPPATVAKNLVDYPADLDKVFDNHGTLDKWKTMKSMTYEIVKKEGNEKQQIDLHSRAERIDGSTFSSGYDGERYWTVADTSYKGNAKFYTNLMFYF